MKGTLNVICLQKIVRATLYFLIFGDPLESKLSEKSLSRWALKFFDKVYFWHTLTIHLTWQDNCGWRWPEGHVCNNTANSRPNYRQQLCLFGGCNGNTKPFRWWCTLRMRSKMIGKRGKFELSQQVSFFRTFREIAFYKWQRNLLRTRPLSHDCGASIFISRVALFAVADSSQSTGFAIYYSSTSVVPCRPYRAYQYLFIQIDLLLYNYKRSWHHY